MPDTLEEMNRYVTCHCGQSVVVSRMEDGYDRFVVCSRGCFDQMTRETDYFSVFQSLRSMENG